MVEWGHVPKAVISQKSNVLKDRLHGRFLPCSYFTLRSASSERRFFASTVTRSNAACKLVFRAARSNSFSSVDLSLRSPEKSQLLELRKREGPTGLEVRSTEVRSDYQLNCERRRNIQGAIQEDGIRR